MRDYLETYSRGAVTHKQVSMRIERDALYTIDEIAEMFGIGKRTAQRMVYSGKVPARKLANKLVIRGADLLDNLPPYTQRSTGRNPD